MPSLKSLKNAFLFFGEVAFHGKGSFLPYSIVYVKWHEVDSIKILTIGFSHNWPSIYATYIRV
jgi:hypothetical protein